jgi:hypothetical protein
MIADDPMFVPGRNGWDCFAMLPYGKHLKVAVLPS